MKVKLLNVWNWLRNARRGKGPSYCRLILTRRNWSIRACSALKKEGLTEGFDWYFRDLVV